jgi:hypothetical protein
MLEKSFRVNSLPFLSTLVKWTTFARLDLGIVANGEDVKKMRWRVYFRGNIILNFRASGRT